MSLSLFPHFRTQGVTIGTNSTHEIALCARLGAKDTVAYAKLCMPLSERVARWPLETVWAVR